MRYDLYCKDCDLITEVVCKLSEYDEKVKKAICTKCNNLMVTRISVPNMTIPGHMTYDGIPKVVGSPHAGKKSLPIPLNIIDEKPDGSYRVTRVGSKKDIDNE